MKLFQIQLFLFFGLIEVFGTIQNYNDTLAHIQWDFAIISYCRKDLIKNWTCGSQICGLHNVTDIQIIYDNDKNNLGYVLYYPDLDSIQIVMRGIMPMSLDDWVGDASNLELVEYPYCEGCKVETSFWNSFLYLEDGMLEAINNTIKKYPHAKINVIGHSLGAAYASLMAGSLYVNKIEINTIYIFGSPRLGNKEISEWFGKIYPNFARIVHHRDIISHVPWETLGYVHINTEIFYDYPSTQYEICPETEQKNCSDQYPIELCDIVPGHSYYMGKSIMPFFLECSNGIESEN